MFLPEEGCLWHSSVSRSSLTGAASGSLMFLIVSKAMILMTSFREEFRQCKSRPRFPDHFPGTQDQLSTLRSGLLSHRSWEAFSSKSMRCASTAILCSILGGMGIVRNSIRSPACTTYSSSMLKKNKSILFCNRYPWCPPNEIDMKNYDIKSIIMQICLRWTRPQVLG